MTDTPVLEKPVNATVDLESLLVEARSPDETNTALVPLEAELSPDSSTFPAPTRPDWMLDEQAEKLGQAADAFLDGIKADPGNMRLADQVNTLGKASGDAMLPHTSLFDRKMNALMVQNQQGNQANLTLVQIKQQMDLINPAVIRAQPLPKRALMGLLRIGSRFPTIQEILNRIYENKETVQSTITGLRSNLHNIAGSLERDREDLLRIYDGLLKGEELLERDIYVGHLIAHKLHTYLQSMPEGSEKENVKGVLATLTSRLIYLKREENANQQFFAGTQMMVQLIRGQIHNITNVARLLERSVMANLALAVSAAELEGSVKTTDMLNEAIDTTLGDTAGRIATTSEMLAEQRARGGANLDKLEKAADEIERAIKLQEQANEVIITKGGDTLRRLEGITTRIRKVTTSGHEGMLEQLN